MFSAYVLTDETREKLLNLFPPKFPEVIARHVTFRFGIPPNAGIPLPAEVKVVGYAEDDSMQALVVSVNGETRRPDGQTFHITYSLDRTRGRRPKDAKVLVSSGFVPTFPVFLETTPRLLS